MFLAILYTLYLYGPVDSHLSNHSISVAASEFHVSNIDAAERNIEERSALIKSNKSRTEPEGLSMSKQLALKPRDAVWQPVAGTKYRFYVYSAYVERRTTQAVRIIAATKTNEPDDVQCTLQLPDNRTFSLNAKIKAIRENWNMNYSASFLLCHLPKSGLETKDLKRAFVSVVSKASPDQVPTNLLKIKETEPKKRKKETLHVCVKPFHFSYSRDDWLVEWFELHQMLGASHFYMYNDSISPTVGCVLNHYVKRGVLTLLPWQLPFISKVEIRTEGQFAAFNDCLYRSMPSASWLLIVDVDEVIIPRKGKSLLALLTVLWRNKIWKYAKPPGAFLFKNVFFYTHWANDPKSPAPLVTARKTRRLTYTNKVKDRSKYAVRPHEAVELGNHFPWEMLNSAPVKGVLGSDALMHHYRALCKHGTDCLTEPSRRDRSAHRFAKPLLRRVTSVKKQILKKCSHVAKKKKYLLLNYGNKIPAIAIETTKFTHSKTPAQQNLVNMLQAAVDSGFKHFAVQHADEGLIGNTIEFIQLNRDDIFLTAKLDLESNGKQNVLPALQATLKRLKTSYVNLYLMNYEQYEHGNMWISLTDYLETWKAMEVAKLYGYAKSIGVMNFNLTQMQRLWKHARVKPSVLHIEVNPTITQNNLIKWCKKHGVVVMASNPFGDIFNLQDPPKRLKSNNTTLVQLTKKYKKTVRQILLRYLLDRSLIPVCEASSPARIRELINVFDFTLKPSEVKNLSSFNANHTSWLANYPKPATPWQKKLSNNLQSGLRSIFGAMANILKTGINKITLNEHV